MYVCKCQAREAYRHMAVHHHPLLWSWVGDPGHCGMNGVAEPVMYNYVVLVHMSRCSFLLGREQSAARSYAYSASNSSRPNRFSPMHEALWSRYIQSRCSVKVKPLPKSPSSPETPETSTILPRNGDCRARLQAKGSGLQSQLSEAIKVRG